MNLQIIAIDAKAESTCCVQVTRQPEAGRIEEPLAPPHLTANRRSNVKNNVTTSNLKVVACSRSVRLPGVRHVWILENYLL